MQAPRTRTPRISDSAACEAKRTTRRVSLRYPGRKARHAGPVLDALQCIRKNEQDCNRRSRRTHERTWITLGRDRLRMLTIHHGRHTFISHALAGGRTLAEVRDAAGHSSVLVTSAYLHVAVEDKGEVGDLFRVG